MSRKQLAVLFLCDMVPATVGIAIIALLPVYAVQLGASEAVTGFLISLAFGTLAIGTLISGWLSDRFQRRKLTLVLVGALGLLATFLMGQVSQIALITLLTMTVWFAAGVTVTTVNILTGIYADPEARGRTFGIIGATVGLGRILGGFGSGAIVDRWGFMALFTLVSLVWMIQIVAVLFLSDPVKTRPQEDEVRSKGMSLPTLIWLLMAAHLLAVVADSSGGLGRPLMMDGLGFDATSISGALAMSGFVTLPLPVLAGWLSDKLGRTRLMMLCYLAVSIGTFALASATDLWHFWLSTALTTSVMSGLSVGLALVNDLVSADTLATAVSRYSATPWIAGVIGFGGTGIVINALGLQTTFLLMALLPIISIVLIFAAERQIRPILALGNKHEVLQ